MEQTLTPVAVVPSPAYPTLKESWASLGWFLLVTVGVVVVVLMPVKALSHVQGWNSRVLSLGLSILVNPITVLWLRHRAGPGRWLGLRWRGPRERGLAYALLLLIVPAEVAILSAQWFLHLPDWSAGERFAELAKHPLLAFLLGCVAAPVTEEILFRGVLLRGLLRNYRPAVAIGQSALLFGIMHANPAQSVNALLMGLLLGWVYYKSRSLWLCIGLHALHNTIAFGARAIPSLTNDQNPLWLANRLAYAGVLAVAALVLVASLWALARTVDKPLPVPATP